MIHVVLEDHVVHRDHGLRARPGEPGEVALGIVPEVALRAVQDGVEMNRKEPAEAVVGGPWEPGLVNALNLERCGGFGAERAEVEVGALRGFLGWAGLRLGGWVSYRKRERERPRERIARRPTT